MNTAQQQQTQQSATRTATDADVLSAAIDQTENILKRCGPEALEGLSQMRKAHLMAVGIESLRKSITLEMTTMLMSLQGTALGFRTDKDKSGGYMAKDVKDCAIEAALKGASWTGNEFNIIAGRCYFTREFFTRKLREHKSLSDMRIDPGIPTLKGDRGAIVDMEATWNYDGIADSLKRCIPIRVNAGMGSDAILGKADRKIKHAIWAQITGSSHSDGEVGDVAAVTSGPSSIEALTDRLNSTKEPATEEKPRLETPAEAMANEPEKASDIDWDQVAHDLSRATCIADCQSYLRKWESLAANDDEKIRLEHCCEVRKEEIQSPQTHSQSGTQQQAFDASPQA